MLAVLAFLYNKHWQKGPTTTNNMAMSFADMTDCLFTIGDHSSGDWTLSRSHEYYSNIWHPNFLLKACKAPRLINNDERTLTMNLQPLGEAVASLSTSLLAQFSSLMPYYYYSA